MSNHAQSSCFKVVNKQETKQNKTKTFISEINKHSNKVYGKMWVLPHLTPTSLLKPWDAPRYSSLKRPPKQFSPSFGSLNLSITESVGDDRSPSITAHVSIASSSATCSSPRPAPQCVCSLVCQSHLQWFSLVQAHVGVRPQKHCVLVIPRPAGCRELQLYLWRAKSTLKPWIAYKNQENAFRAPSSEDWADDLHKLSS